MREVSACSTQREHGGRETPLIGRPDVENPKATGGLHGLIKALRQKKDAKVHLVADSALGRIGDSKTVEPLIVCLTDRTGFGGQAAANALSRIRKQHSR